MDILALRNASDTYRSGAAVVAAQHRYIETSRVSVIDAAEAIGPYQAANFGPNSAAAESRYQPYDDPRKCPFPML